MELISFVFGSRDKSILQRDIRCQEDHVSKLTGHKSEVCGLKWYYNNRELASGGNDNKLLVWNQHSTQPVLRYCEHTAAFKAIAWSPHLHGFLASGGVTAYRCIRFWNTTTNTHLNCVETSSQVCNLAWSKNVNELVNTHGYSQNIIVVWKYLTMTKLATLTGTRSVFCILLFYQMDRFSLLSYLHNSYFFFIYLHLHQHTCLVCCQTIVTGAGDETLRFWNIFPSPKSQDKDESSKSIQKGLHVVSFSIGSSVEFVYCDQMNDKPEHGSREPADYEEEEELYLEPAINLRLSDLAYTQFVFF
ncbi:unnamed protein product [Eruca vesicaria subsp. sativa]|uniref:CDC20/Fizzy WD40 domain-containing protein n=1 Tax=Eruca vesicaria subsp. sativa TaxID=29727 RepID=A0ABC8KYC5_ERUVS|nr:unnamed protein product [Eruca vesicaria subsp. sativa]